MFIRKFSTFCPFLLFLAGCVNSSTLKTDAQPSANPVEVIAANPKVVTADIPSPHAAPQPSKLTLYVYETKRCKICKELLKPLRKLEKEAKGGFVIQRIDASHSKALEKHRMQPLFPGFYIEGPELETPLRRYGRGSFEDIQTWLLAGDARSYRVPLSQSPSHVSKPYEAVLVAGSSDNANFAQEVIWLKNILEEKGMPRDAISCFYAMPDPVSYFVDKEQFDQIAEEIKECRPALRDDIVQAVKTSLSLSPPNFFFYATAHGHPPDKAPVLKESEKDCDSRAPSLALDEGTLDCDAENHLTPKALVSAASDSASTATEKVFVFQGCYTGGFISSKDNPQKFPSVLAQLPNTTLFTASRSDRPSFGCAPGTNATIYGGSFVKAFIEDANPVGRSDWKAINKRTRRTVQKLESELGITEKSEPKFFQTSHTIP